MIRQAIPLAIAIYLATIAAGAILNHAWSYI
mgnify:CR=1 FL=1